MTTKFPPIKQRGYVARKNLKLKEKPSTCRHLSKKIIGSSEKKPPYIIYKCNDCPHTWREYD